MLIHSVFCEIRPEVTEGEVRAVFARLAGLSGLVPGFLDFKGGPNRDYEAKSGRWTWGFTCTFTDRAAHLAYDAHPDHKAAGAELCALCVGGYDGIIVFDIEA